MREEYLTRQLDILPMHNLSKRITVIGAGAIGSFTVLALAKMGFSNITVWDNDHIDQENMNCQFYRISDIGKLKVDALRDMVQDFTGTLINIESRRLTSEDRITDHIIISAVDSMAARKLISEQFYGRHLLDARMGAEYISTYYVDRRDIEGYANFQEHLYSDSEALPERCTAKSTMYTVSLIAGLLGKSVKDIVSGNAPISSLDWSVAKNSAVWFTDGKKGTM